MPPEIGRDRSDLVLNPGEFAFVQDRSKGNIGVSVGPIKTSMSDTEATVVWDNQAKRFRQVSQDQAVQPFTSVPDGSYVILSNPAKSNVRPDAGKSTNAVDLDQGRRIHLNGPQHFPLWPGEVAQVVEGHQLRSNEYLVVRVYNEDVARQHWAEAVLKPQVSTRSANSETAPVSAESQPATLISGFKSDDLRTGQLLIIRGNEISFFIPPTGIEVVPAQGKYIRSAVTLERLEYCILLNEDGNKRYVRGPSVVFPDPTEVFIENSGEVKFKATELTSNSGVYVKVIEDYTDESGEHKTGEELFITGKQTPIYFPRQEHSIVTYGKSGRIHYAVAVPKGEGRYVLNRETGNVSLVKGPVMLLPDPRVEVIVQRVIDPQVVELWYPGNAVAKAHNEGLSALSSANFGEDYVTMEALGSTRERTYGTLASSRSSELVGESMKRGSTFTPPRTVTLNTKYDGAVSVSPWTGFAIQITDKNGDRRVVKGPATALLEYDETLTVMELLTGTPKTDARVVKTAYLRVQNNRVSDVVDSETQDLCKVSIKLAYRVNFEGEDERKWFAVENYVRLLTEHCGSRIRNAVKKLGIEAFYGDPISVIRDAILGVSKDGKRDGRKFEENGMRVYDVEVLDVTIRNPEIANLLSGAQHAAVRDTLAIAQAEAQLDRTRRKEVVSRDEAASKDETAVALATIKAGAIQRERDLNLAQVSSEAEVVTRRKQLEQALQPILDEIAKADLARRENLDRQSLAIDKDRMDAETASVNARMEVLKGELAQALTRFADQALMEKLAGSFNVMSILENESVANLFGRYIDGMPLAHVLDAVKSRGSNGARTPVTSGQR